jgi:hypothetical protein
MENENQNNDLIQSFLNSDLNDTSYFESKPKEDYYLSDYRIQKYKNLTKNDEFFGEYIKSTYGSEENFFQFNPSLLNSKTYDPSTDFLVEVSIVTKDVNYKAGFISTTELILENINGVTTIEYFKVNGLAAKIVGTLNTNLIPSAQASTRKNAFTYLNSNRVLIWDLQKQGWSSFYMNRLIRFVKDDTSGVE